MSFYKNLDEKQASDNKVFLKSESLSLALLNGFNQLFCKE